MCIGALAGLFGEGGGGNINQLLKRLRGNQDDNDPVDTGSVPKIGGNSILNEVGNPNDDVIRGKQTNTQSRKPSGLMGRVARGAFGMSAKRGLL